MERDEKPRLVMEGKKVSAGWEQWRTNQKTRLATYSMPTCIGPSQDDAAACTASIKETERCPSGVTSS
eukprot:12867669-Ditylum_brightwellii.AAC.1